MEEDLTRTIKISCQISLNDIIDGIFNELSQNELIELIRTIDYTAEDVGFTLELVKKLIQSLLSEEEITSSDYLQNSLIGTFSTRKTVTGASTWETLHSESEKRCKILKSMLKSIDKLDSIPGS